MLASSSVARSRNLHALAWRSSGSRLTAFAGRFTARALLMRAGIRASSSVRLRACLASDGVGPSSLSSPDVAEAAALCFARGPPASIEGVALTAGVRDFAWRLLTHQSGEVPQFFLVCESLACLISSASVASSSC